jgi:predicted transposase/invertase (TIGR01784 family)
MIFGAEENKDILIDLLKSILKLPDNDFEIIEILNPYSINDYHNDRTVIYDIKIKTKNEKLIDIEIQLLNKTGMLKRILYYGSKMIASQMKKGDSNFDIIKQSVAIFIIDFILFEEDNRYHHSSHLRDDYDLEILTKDLEINVLELPKLPDKDDSSKLWKWLKFLKSDRIDESLEIIAKENKYILKAVEVVKRLSKDPKSRMIYEARLKEVWDKNSEVDFAIKKGKMEGKIEGKIEGLQEGEKKKQIQIARNLLLKNQSFDFISEITGLSIDEIKEIEKIEQRP